MTDRNDIHENLPDPAEPQSAPLPSEDTEPLAKDAVPAESEAVAGEETVGVPDSDSEAVVAEGAKPPKKDSFVFTIFEYLEILAFSVCAVLLLFTLCMRLCRVNGSSMRNTLYNGEMLITTNLVTPEAGDIIVFHMTSEKYDHFNEPLVKRIIATEGQTVRIDYTTKLPTLYVDGVAVEEAYDCYLDNSGRPIDMATQYPAHHFNTFTGIFEITVPEGQLFVMGDNRNHSADSRTVEVGLVDARRVLGKVILRLKPFTTFD